MAIYNSYYCFVDEKKLTKAEWEIAHKRDVEEAFVDEFGYWHCDTFENYSKAFDEHMAHQIEKRDYLRKWYVDLMKTPFSDKWARDIGDFNETFKECYGRSPWFWKDMLTKKGISIEDIHNAWDRMED